MVQIKDTLAEAIVAFSSVAESTARTEDRLQAAAVRLETSVDLFLSRQQEILDALNGHSRRFTNLLVLTLLLSTVASAAAFVLIFFSILTGK